jgi:hypothetical protein
MDATRVDVPLCRPDDTRFGPMVGATHCRSLLIDVDVELGGKRVGDL